MSSTTVTTKSTKPRAPARKPAARSKAKTITTKKVVSKRARGRTGKRTGGGIATYIRALNDPFFAPVPKLGFGCFTPTSRLTAFLETPTVAGFTASVTGCVVMTDFTITKTMSYAPFTTAQLGVTLGTIGVGNVAASNSVLLGSQAQAARVVSGAMRVKVRAANSVLPGTLGMVVVTGESYANILLNTPNSLMALPGYRSCTATDTGSIGGEGQYRPTDMFDFEFKPGMLSGYSTSTGVYHVIFVASGWNATNFAIEVCNIMHYECIGGADPGFDPDESTLASAGVTSDNAGAAANRSGDPYKLSLGALKALNAVTSHISRVRRSQASGGGISSYVRAGLNDTSNSIEPSHGLSNQPAIRYPGNKSGQIETTQDHTMASAIRALQADVQRLLDKSNDEERKCDTPCEDGELADFQAVISALKNDSAASAPDAVLDRARLLLTKLGIA